jgi:hypothetical protein
MYSLPDLGDPLFSIWRMGWIYRQILGDPRPLSDANIFHPEPLTLAYSDAMLLPSLTAAPLLAANLHPVLVYNLMLLSGFLFSGLVTYLLVQRLTGSTRAAFVAALIYGFYPYRFEHYSHLELQMTHWMPLGLVALHRFADTQRLRPAMVAALCGVAQLYSSMYYGVFFLVYGLVIAAVLVASRRGAWRKVVAPAAAGVVAALICAVPLARPYSAAQARRGTREAVEIQEFSARPSDYLRANRRSPRWGPVLLGDRKVERALFPGGTPLALSAIALVPPLGATRVAYAAGLLVAFDGSLGFNGILYPYLYDFVPAVRGLRVPARFSVIAGLSLAILAGFGVRRLLSRVAGWKARAVFAGLIVAVVFDLQPSLPLVPAWRTPPPVYAGLGAPGDVVLAEFPFPINARDIGRNLPYMYFSVWHGSAMVNGYSGFVPPDYPEFARGLAGFPDESSLVRLRQRGVTHVTVNCALARGPCDAVLDACAAASGLRFVMQARWEGSAVYVYRLLY